jgi:DNA-binding response OmpR family regulator
VKAGHGRTILVVEDDAAMRLLCRVNLELDGYRVLEAETVDAAAEHAANEEIDVVLLDIRLGEGLRSGLGLLERLPGERRPAVVLVTGSVDLGELASPTGVDAVLSKPFALEELTRTVGRLALRRVPRA